MIDEARVQRRFVWSMRLILAGLGVELVSLFGLHHPLGFMLFATVGCSLMALGIVLFLISMRSLRGVPSAKEDTSST